MKTFFSGQDTWFAKHGEQIWDDICHKFTPFTPNEKLWFSVKDCVRFVHADRPDGYKRQRVSFILNKMIEEQDWDNPIIIRIGNSYRLLL